ncbi:MAG: serine/threonine protein kinase [Verrucomicrobiae bacterium]|nr:serine/threonine protein kinase [Verrucomicrobiae bacterium]
MADDDLKDGGGATGGEEVDSGANPEINHCPSCGGVIDIAGLAPFSKVICPHCDESVRVRTCLGNYQILKMLGEGGMSQVFLAEDLALDRQVALKILHQDLSRDAALMALFEREAKLTASISHPNVVKVYTVGSDNGYFFIAMELVDNVSLEQRILDQGLLAEREALDLLHDVASGLRAAYQGGLIHRDIKPGNILLTEDHTGKLVDFGLAVQQGGDDEVEDLWATPFYVPPEKLDGKPDDFRGDIYSLGATFFHALAGRPPFDANTASLDELREIKARPVSLHHAGAPVSAATAKLIDQMMAYKPETRPKSYEALLKAIEEVQARLPGGAASRSRRHQALGSERKRFSWPVIIGIGGGSLAVLGLVISMIVGKGFGFLDSGTPDTFLGEGDRVLSAGEKAVAARYNEARSLLLDGRFGAAATAFSSLLESQDIKQPTRGWTEFHAGLAAMLNGESPAKAREYFAEMAKAPGFEDASEALAAQGEFFKKAGRMLSDPLPVLPGAEENFASGSFERFALLAFGLKNWNQGQFDSGLAFLDQFAKSDFSTGFSWMGAYRELVEPYRADAERVPKLPKPSISMSEDELVRIKSELEEKVKAFKTKGGARTLAQQRAERVDTILTAKKALAAAPPEPARNSDSTTKGSTGPAVADAGGADPATMPNGVPKPPAPGESAAAEWTDEALAEKEEFGEVANAAGAAMKDYRFEAARESLSAYAAKTEAVDEVRGDYLVAIDDAKAFRDRLIAFLGNGDWEGKLARKQGLAIDCKVVAAQPDKLVVDLMFGPNDLPLAEVAPAWMLATAREAWLVNPPDDSNVSDWIQAVWFARETGLDKEAEQLSETLTPLSEEFAARWKRLDGLP